MSFKLSLLPVYAINVILIFFFREVIVLHCILKGNKIFNFFLKGTLKSFWVSDLNLDPWELLVDLVQCFSNCGEKCSSKAIVKCLIREKIAAHRFCHVCGLRIAVVSASAVNSNSSIPIQT